MFVIDYVRSSEYYQPFCVLRICLIQELTRYKIRKHIHICQLTDFMKSGFIEMFFYKNSTAITNRNGCHVIE